MIWKSFTLVSLLFLAACQSPPPSCEQQLSVLDVTDWTALREREFDGPVDESSEGARIVHHYDATETVRRITVTFFGERGRRELDYRLVSDNTFSLNVTDVDYARPISPDQPTRAAAKPIARYQICDGVPLLRPTDDAVHEQMAPFIKRLASFKALAAG